KCHSLVPHAKTRGINAIGPCFTEWSLCIMNQFGGVWKAKMLPATLASLLRADFVRVVRSCLLQNVIPALTVGIIVTVGSAPAQADVDLYEVGNLKITVGLTGGVGMFGVANVDFGRGNQDYSSGKVRLNRGWFEAWAAPSISFEYLLDDAPTYLS